ncbi:MAG TPA: hypothetical protein VLK29_05180, partial [Luteimonas sp.]|nr:hypothetical protein [Luteimonas sp.]
MQTLLLATATVAVALLLAGWYRRRRLRALAAVLDAADALEARLRLARAEIEALTEDGADPVRGALQEMLRQRLWLQQHGSTASLRQLGAVRDGVDAATRRIDGQLQLVAQAR